MPLGSIRSRPHSRLSADGLMCRSSRRRDAPGESVGRNKAIAPYKNRSRRAQSLYCAGRLSRSPAFTLFTFSNCRPRGSGDPVARRACSCMAPQEQFWIRASARAGTTTTKRCRPRRRSPRSPTAAAPIGDARVAGAIGKAGERLVAAEAEILGAGLVDRPAALPLLELEQRAAAPVVNRYLLGLRLR